jgi:GNAT superfamily N-acetyltransferase
MRAIVAAQERSGKRADTRRETERVMNLRYERFPSAAGRSPDDPAGLLGDLRFLRERRGEKIAAVDEDSDVVLAALSINPERDEGGAFFRLDAIEVHPAHRGEGLESGLLEEAEKHLRAHKCNRLKFGTSPLLTANAALYMTRFGTRYRWREGARTPDGQPWPYVTCECDFDDPLARPLDLRDDEAAGRSVLAWEDGKPRRRTPAVYTGPLSVVLPDLGVDSIAHASAEDPTYLPILYEAFHELSRHGYGFAWFDRLPPGASAAAGTAPPRWYYLMHRVLAL